MSARWEGVIEVCNTCDRKVQWPFCEHKTHDGRWYRLAVVREVGRSKSPSNGEHVDGHAGLCGLCGEPLSRPQMRCPAYKGHAHPPESGEQDFHAECWSHHPEGTPCPTARGDLGGTDV